MVLTESAYVRISPEIIDSSEELRWTFIWQVVATAFEFASTHVFTDTLHCVEHGDSYPTLATKCQDIRNVSCE